MKSAKRNALRVAAATAASGLLAAGAVTLAAGSASAATLQAHGGSRYSFQTIDNPKDLTFNQLLGINDERQIVGYFGSGAAGHPNKGYVIPPFSHSFVDENFPGSVQTQVTGENNRGVTVGFWSNTNMGVGKDANFGWVLVHGQFRNASDPLAAQSALETDQLLGVNDEDVAVGFYTDANGNNRGYEYNIGQGRFSEIAVPGVTSLTAAAINDRGDVAGAYTAANGNTDGFLLRHGHLTDLAAPGAASTMALGVNNFDEVVGVWADAAGNMHGFTWTAKHGFTTVDDPHGLSNGMTTTTINGVNDFGQLVGFYVDANGNTDGFLASPQR
jgi:hypothetical protein